MFDLRDTTETAFRTYALPNNDSLESVLQWGDDGSVFGSGLGHTCTYCIRIHTAPLNIGLPFESRLEELGSASSLNDRYEMFLTILNHSCLDRWDGFLLSSPHFLPTCRESWNTGHAFSRALAQRTQCSLNSGKFRKYSKRFENLLAKYDKNVERRIVNSENINDFYRFVKRKLENDNKIRILKKEMIFQY